MRWFRALAQRGSFRALVEDRHPQLIAVRGEFVGIPGNLRLMRCEMVEASEAQKRAERKKFDSWSNHIARRTVTFHWVDEQGVPLPNGTGVLLRIGRSCFILTAAHVVDEIKDKIGANGRVFVVGGGVIEKPPISLDGGVLLSSPLAGNSRVWHDLYDIAAIELRSPVIKPLEGDSSFLELAQLDLAVDHDDGGQFYIYGVPSRYNQPDHDRGILSVTAFPIATKLFTGDRDAFIFFDSDIGLAFDFDAHAGMGEGSPRVAPPLGGMSGCGIWKIVSADQQFMEADPAEAKLVAIEHKEVTSAKAIVGTRIKFVLQMIWNDYPVSAWRHRFRVPFP
jgi:hypothetical protein